MKSLLKIARAYNNSIKTSIHKIPLNQSKEKLWKDIKLHLNNHSPCPEDYCLLDLSLVSKIKDNELLHHTFRPDKPPEWNKNKFTWLSNIDIDEAMSQYEFNTDFLFIGSVPIDFDSKIGFNKCVVDELCNIDLHKIYISGKRKIGIIFNLDPHYMSGSHWVSLYIDLNKCGIYYFDSYGLPPNKEIIVLIERIKKQGNDMLISNKININNIDNEHRIVSTYTVLSPNKIKLHSTSHLSTIKYNCLAFFTNNKNKLNYKLYNHIINVNNDGDLVLENSLTGNEGSYIVIKSFTSFYNTNRFQFKNSECGVYSMHFIEQFLKGYSFNYIINNIINDDVINKKRDFFFRPSSIKKQ